MPACHTHLSPAGGTGEAMLARVHLSDFMTTQSKRATIYFAPELHRALKLKAVETSRSVSELVNAAVRQVLSGDAEDLEAFEERAVESLFSYAEIVKRLKKDGRI